MFFEENVISSILLCQNCRQKLDDPRVVPCGATICTACIENNSFICRFCESLHSETDSGFPVNKMVKELLAQESKSVYRGKNVEEFKRNLEWIRFNVKKFEMNIQTGEDKIREYCLGQRISVDLVAEEAIEQINRFRSSLLAEIENYETVATQAYRTDEESRRNFTEFIDYLERFENDWTNYLKQPQIDEEKIIATNREALDISEKIKINQIKLRAITFNKELMSFNREFQNFGHNIFGKIAYNQLVTKSLRCVEKFDLSSFLIKSQNINSRNFCIETSDNQLFRILFVDVEESKNVLRYMAINRDLSVLSSCEYDYVDVEALKKYDTSIMVCSFAVDNYHIDILNENLVRTCYKNFSDVTKVKPNDFSMCDANVYYYMNEWEKPLLVLEKREGILNLKDTEGQMTEPNGFLYLPRDLKQLEIHGNKLFWLNGTSLNVLNKEDSRLIKSVEINANKFVFGSDTKVLALDMNNREIRYFDLDLNLLESLCVENLGDYLEDLFLFANKITNQVYIFDKISKNLSFYNKFLEYKE